jgi:hypothetical protein
MKRRPIALPWFGTILGIGRRFAAVGSIADQKLAGRAAKEPRRFARLAEAGLRRNEGVKMRTLKLNSRNLWAEVLVALGLAALGAFGAGGEPFLAQAGS